MIQRKTIRQINYIVALEAYEVDRHWDGAVAVPVQSLDVVEQVCEKLVAPFQHTESHDVVSTHFLHDLSGQPLSPDITRFGEQEIEDSDLSVLQQSAEVVISFQFVSASKCF